MPHVTPAEEWRPVRDHVGYEVSNLGRVRSRRSPGKTPNLEDQWHLIHGSLAVKGKYRVVALQEPRRLRYVHHLVAEAFLGLRPEGLVIAHGDGDSLNNAAANLRYDTQQGNIDDCLRHGTRLRGELLNNAKLTESDVREIRHLYAGGLRNMSELGRRFGVAQQTITKTVRGEFWSHVDGPIDPDARGTGRRAA